MSNLVLDSNILLASVLPKEPLTQTAQAILLNWLQTDTRLIAPRLFRSELVAVMRKAVFQGRVTHEQGRESLHILLDYSVTLIEDDELLIQAYEVARRFNQPRAYDAQYLALALRYGVDYWTGDERLFQ